MSYRARRSLDLDHGRPSRAMCRARALPSQDPGGHAPADLVVPHPRFRGECQCGPRPCPLVGCLYNNYLDVRRHPGEAPRIKILHPNRLPEDVPPRESCSLDMADSGPHTLDQVAQVLGLTRERIRQIEARAMHKILPIVSKQSSTEPSYHKKLFLTPRSQRGKIITR